MTRPEAKICGINDAHALDVALAKGAERVGFVFFPPSPRHVSIEQAAALGQMAQGRAARVGLFVNPSDDGAHIVIANTPLDMIQLHGTETPQRTRALRGLVGLPVIKAVPVSQAADLDAALVYEEAADWLLFDAKPPKGARLPGGNGLAFDWRLLAGRSWRTPWMLSGGLHPLNVAEAVMVSGARAVDVSSGVESRPGVKDANRIDAFMDALASLVPSRRQG
jgi:phosphoribosylanthranilate isomerase